MLTTIAHYIVAYAFRASPTSHTDVSLRWRTHSRTAGLGGFLANLTYTNTACARVGALRS